MYSKNKKQKTFLSASFLAEMPCPSSLISRTLIVTPKLKHSNKIFHHCISKQNLNLRYQIEYNVIINNYFAVQNYNINHEKPVYILTLTERIKIMQNTYYTDL